MLSMKLMEMVKLSRRLGRNAKSSLTSQWLPYIINRIIYGLYPEKSTWFSGNELHEDDNSNNQGTIYLQLLLVEQIYTSVLKEAKLRHFLWNKVLWRASLLGNIDLKLQPEITANLQTAFQHKLYCSTKVTLVIHSNCLLTPPLYCGHLSWSIQVGGHFRDSFHCSSGIELPVTGQLHSLCKLCNYLILMGIQYLILRPMHTYAHNIFHAHNIFDAHICSQNIRCLQCIFNSMLTTYSLHTHAHKIFDAYNINNSMLTIHVYSLHTHANNNSMRTYAHNITRRM